MIDGLPFSTTVGFNFQTSAIDFADASRFCLAVLNIGDVENEGTIHPRIEESDNGSDWNTVANFQTYDTANHVEVISFIRSKQYLRGAGSIAGSGVVWTVGVAVLDVQTIPVSSGGLRSQLSGLSSKLSGL